MCFCILGRVLHFYFVRFIIAHTIPFIQNADDYIRFFNEERPAYSLSYLTPKQYREKYAA